MTGSHSSPPHPPGSLRRAGLRFSVLILLLAASFVVIRWTPVGEYLHPDRLRELLRSDQFKGLLVHLRTAWWAPIVHISLYVVFGAIGVPATPFLIAGAAIFGTVWGTLWNWVGITLASGTGYLLARLLGREFVERIGGSRIRRAEKILHRRGFLPLVAVRFVPIPFALVNAAAAVVGVRFSKFMLASGLGYFPPVAIITYFTSAILAAATGERAAIARHLLYATVAAAVLVFLPIALGRRARKRRLRQIRAARADRSLNRPPEGSPQRPS